ncbi:MAG: TetR/AcrR family transcriptional regulator [Spirochaetes bacterium]|nr:TetR/AcrR family transcriptional regulator [Spirochaetota bacterium]
MANKTRSPEIINFQKQQMSKAALEIIVKEGYNNLSIRKLSNKLGISPTTIYNYFKNREEIYIYVLNNGFEMLYEELKKSYAPAADPVDKLRALSRAFFSFSTRERELAYIMLILDTPKYYDYLETEYEPFMRIELSNALKCRDEVIKIISEISDRYPALPKDEVAFRTYSIIAKLVGLITTCNNNLIKYLIDESEGAIERMLDDIMGPFEAVRERRHSGS